MRVQLVLLFVLALSSSPPPPAFLSPALYTYLSDTSRPPWIGRPLCESDLWKLAWNGLYLPMMYLCSRPASLYLHCCSSKPVRLSRAVMSLRWGLQGLPYRRTVILSLPPPPLLTSSCCCLLLCTSLMTSHISRPHTPWHDLTQIFLTTSLQTHFLFVCMHRNLVCTH